MALHKLTSLKSDIKGLLETVPQLRDSDNLLVSTYYSILLKNQIAKLSGVALLKLIRDGRLPSGDNICRVRRKIQADTPELRGKTYLKRKELEVEVRENISEL
jgi:hypothetical protein